MKLFKPETMLSIGLLFPLTCSKDSGNPSQIASHDKTSESLDGSQEQVVAALVPKAWKEIHRLSGLRDKAFLANFYGGDSKIQIGLFEGDRQIDFDPSVITVNSQNIRCHAAEELSAGFSLGKTSECTFTPQILMQSLQQGSRASRDYWMRVALVHEAERSIRLRYYQPRVPQCFDAADEATFNVLGSCGQVQDVLKLSSQISKPVATTIAGKAWTPLAPENMTFEITLKVRGGRALLLNGVKMKQSGNPVASPNDELAGGILFEPGCALAELKVLDPGSYSCRFVTGQTGFIHVPLQKISDDPIVEVTLEAKE